MNLTAISYEWAGQVQGDFDTFFRTHFERVARSAALITGDRASGPDLAQEAMLRLHTRWSDMSSDDHARNFVYKVAANLSRSHRRKYMRVVPIGLAPADREGPSVESRSDDWPAMSRSLASLSMRQRACVVLVDYADMDSSQAGRALGISDATVRVHLARGRRALRIALGMTEAKDEA